MKLNIKPKIEIKECITRKERFKTFKFYLKTIDYGIHIPHKKLANTYFFCQRVDICFVDKNDTIIALYENVKSEKLIYKRKANSIYFLPLNTVSKLKLGNKLPLIK